MARLEIKVDGKDVGATKMLSAATSMLRILQSIEKSQAKEKGIKPSIRWRVDMQSGNDYGLIAIRAEPASRDKADEASVTEFLAEAYRRLKG